MSIIAQRQPPPTNDKMKYPGGSARAGRSFEKTKAVLHMRKSTKLLSMLLVVCMLVSLMPVGVLAAEPTGPKAASACTLGDPEAAYKLNIVNDAATLMLFEVTVNG